MRRGVRTRAESRSRRTARTATRRRCVGPRPAAGCMRESRVRSQALGESADGGDSLVHVLVEGLQEQKAD